MAELDQHIPQNFEGFLMGLKMGHEVFRIMVEEFQGISLVDFHPGFEDVGIHVVRSFFNQRSPLQSLEELIGFVDVEDDNLFDLEVPLKQVGLLQGARNPVEEEQLLRGEVAVCRDQAMDKVMPNLDRRFIGEQESFCGVPVIELAGGRLWRETSKNIPRGEMEVIAGAAQELPKSALSRARRAKNKNRAERLSMFGNDFFLCKRHGNQPVIYRKQEIQTREDLCQ